MPIFDNDNRMSFLDMSSQKIVGNCPLNEMLLDQKTVSDIPILPEMHKYRRIGFYNDTEKHMAYDI